MRKVAISSTLFLFSQTTTTISGNGERHAERILASGYLKAEYHTYGLDALTNTPLPVELQVKSVPADEDTADFSELSMGPATDKMSWSSG